MWYQRVEGPPKAWVSFFSIAGDGNGLLICSP